MSGGDTRYGLGTQAWSRTQYDTTDPFTFSSDFTQRLLRDHSMSHRDIVALFIWRTFVACKKPRTNVFALAVWVYSMLENIDR